LGGMMKPMQAKKVIKSIPILKKKVGDKFVIAKGEVVVENTEEKIEDKAESTTDNKPAGKKLTPEQKEKIKVNMTKIDAKLKQIAKALKIQS
jgi:hypothetical protein